jgi:two-component system sensor histidine kinase PilS (NtrC family)
VQRTRGAPAALAPLRTETAAAGAGHETYPTWRALNWFTAFRLFIAFGLVVFFVPALGSAWRAPGALPETGLLTLGYTVLVLLGALGNGLRWPGKDEQVQVAVFVDIVAYTLIMHHAGGLVTGLGLLLAIAVAAGALLMEGRLSLLFASLAALAVLLQQAFVQVHGGPGSGSLTTAGLLGLTFFAVALLAHVLYRRIQAAEELAAQRQVDVADLSKLNEFVIQLLGTGVLVVDGERRVRLLNNAARHLLEAPTADRGANLEQIAPDLAGWLARYAPARVARDEGLVLRGTEIRVSLHLLGPYRSSGALLFLRDQREVARAAQQIKLASLGRLTASIAHNIRNPLSAIGHAGQLLAESPALGAEDLHLLEIIRRNTRRIDEIIESVLQLSRRDRGKPEPIDPAAWLPELAAEIRQTHGLPPETLAVDVAEDTPPLNADPRHLHQVLSNLCDNAVHHGAPANGPLRIELRARPDPTGGVLVEVSDNGPGIEPQTAREIFAPFFTTSRTGTGLGLYIARELCEINGIGLEHRPEVAQGACFRLSFPGA